VRVWTRCWGALQLFHPHLLTLNARTQRLEGRPPVTPATARGATPRAGALGNTTARSRPWRAGVRPARTHARKHLQKSVLGSKAGSSQIETRHRGGSPRHDAAWLGSLHTGQPGSLTSTGNSWYARPGLGAGVRCLRHRVLPTAQTNSAQRPRHRT
jgi:hypothetical protein